MGFARANGVVLHSERTGPADAPLLVFANSLGTDFRIWRPLLACLGDRFDCLLYDKRGHGLSDCPPAPYRLEDHIADLIALLEQQQVRQAIIVGLSVGGMIAQGLAVVRPDLVRGLVLCDTAHRIGPPEMWQTRMTAIRAGGIGALAGPILERWFSPAFHRHSPDELAGWRNMLLRTPLEGYLGTCAAIRDADLTEQARRLDLPALCVVGDQDGATPPDLVRSLAELIPGARFAEIPGAGHLPCIEAPAFLGGLMMEYFGEIGVV